MDLLNQIFGLELKPEDMNVLQICSRAAVIFLAALVIVRVANRRFMAKFSPLDVIMGFILAATLARAVNGGAPLLPSMAAGFLLVLLHRVLAAVSCRSHRAGLILKGSSVVIIQNGIVQDHVLAKHNISRHDLEQALRVEGRLKDISQVELATLERDGEISVVPKPGES